MLEQPFSQDRLWPKAELAQPFGRGVNFQIDVADVNKIHGDITVAGLNCVLQLEERWYRRNGIEIGARQFAVQVPDGYLIRLAQSLRTRPIT
jgi:lactoylglutathione lyase